MSRIGLKPIALPATVKYTINGNDVEVTGPKGTVKALLPTGIRLEANDGNRTACTSFLALLLARRPIGHVSANPPFARHSLAHDAVRNGGPLPRDTRSELGAPTDAPP